MPIRDRGEFEIYFGMDEIPQGAVRIQVGMPADTILKARGNPEAIKIISDLAFTKAYQQFRHIMREQCVGDYMLLGVEFDCGMDLVQIGQSEIATFFFKFYFNIFTSDSAMQMERLPRFDMP